MPSELPPGVRRFDDFDAAWATREDGRRLRAVRAAAERVRDRFAHGPRVVCVRTLSVAEFPYPARFAFGGAARSPAPFVALAARCLVVQFLQGGRLRTLLFNPIDAVALPSPAPRALRLPSRLASIATRRELAVAAQLAAFGIAPADVDYVAFDHLHRKDVRPALGADDGAIAGAFPNAVLLADAGEWSEWDDPHPLLRAAFVEDGKRGVLPARVALVDGDLALGDGVLLVRAPGRTRGHRALFVNTQGGVWGMSDDGVAVDAWSPLDSKIGGLAAHCRRHGVDVVPHATPGASPVDQATSMVLERTIVDRVPRAPAFVQMLPSNEVVPSALAPGLSPTLLHRGVASGVVARAEARGVRAAE